METFSRFSSLEQFSFNNILGYASELKCNEQGTGYLPTSGPKEVICPEPRRAGWAPYSVETPTRSSYKFKRNWPSHRGDQRLDFSIMFSGKDDTEDEFDATNCQVGLPSCSPPVRTSNPIVHDVQFIRQTSVLDFVPQDTQDGRYPSRRVEVVPTHGTSTGQTPNPMTRIEGFACGGSKSHCISANA